MGHSGECPTSHQSMKIMQHSLRLAVIVLAVGFLFGCGRAPSRSEIVDRIKKETAKVLKVDAANIAINRPLSDLGASDLDSAQIAVAVEEAFQVELLDEDFLEPSGGTANSLSVEDIAVLVGNKLAR